MIRKREFLCLSLLCLASAVLLSGCPVPPGVGYGKTSLRTCRASGGQYYLYIPQNYNAERRYPLVVTLHGMKPWDSAPPHIDMWDIYADKYGYIVLAPVLWTSDSFGQFPLKTMGRGEQRDAEHILACMDEVVSDWQIDQQAVLLSSWSMGGYLAHYLACEQGHRFTAFAPLQSNFSNSVLNAVKARQWSSRLPIFVFYGARDFPAVTNESKESLEWYRRLGFQVTSKFEDVGHQRHPELAADFFESVLARRQKNLEILVTPPGNEPAPLAVNLWPALSSKIGEVRTYIWDFGKLGGPSYQKSPNVLIRQPGDYPVRLTVVDKNGQKYSTETTLRVPATRAAQGGSVAPRTGQ